MATFSLFSVTIQQPTPEPSPTSIKSKVSEDKVKNVNVEDSSPSNKPTIESQVSEKSSDSTPTSTGVELVGPTPDSVSGVENYDSHKSAEDADEPTPEVTSSTNDDVKEAKKHARSPSVEYVSPISKEELLRDILKRFKVKSSTWMRSIDNITTVVTFTVESGRKEEDVLDALVTCGIGTESGTSVSISPTTVCLSFDLKKQGKSKKETSEPAAAANSPETPKDNELPAIDKQVSAGSRCVTLPEVDESDDLLGEKENSVEGDVEEGDFMKSIKARIIIQPIVATLRKNAEFTFDYLVFIILASVISAVGLIENNSVILVASMLISPLMGPILAATFGSAVDDVSLRNVGIKSELIGLLLCILTGFLVGLPVTYIMMGSSKWRPAAGSWPSPEMYGRGLPRSIITGAVIALVSGMAVALSVLGNNQGSLVGVAISASLLPPAVNSGLLWAHSLQAAIARVVDSISSNETAAASGLSNSTPTDLSACPHMGDNSYSPHFYCDMAGETFVLGVMSLTLTVVNIILIVLAAMLCLKVKQVSPRASVANEQMFWMKHMKVAKHYNTTIHPSTDLGAALIKDLKTALQVSDNEAQRILEERQFVHKPLEFLRCNSEASINPQRYTRVGSEDHSLLLRSLSHAPQLESTEFVKKSVLKRGRFKIVKD